MEPDHQYEMSYLEIRTKLYEGVGMRDLRQIRPWLARGLMVNVDVSLAHKASFCRATFELFCEYMPHEERDNLRFLLQALDTDKFDNDIRVCRNALALHRYNVCILFARAIRRVAKAGQLKETLAPFLARRLIRLLRNLPRVVKRSWRSKMKTCCKKAFRRLKIRAPEDVFGALDDGEEDPSDTQSSRSSPKPGKHRDSASPGSQRDESQPGPSCSGESQPGRGALHEPPPRRESLRERQPSRESLSGSLPSPKGLRERQPSQESLGERIPSREGSRERQPSNESLGERMPSREGFRERQPSHESLDERIPSREGFRERQPSRESPHEPQPGNRWLPELECVDYSSSGSGSETHPGMKKGTSNPYVGGFKFPKEHLDLRVRITAGSSGQAEPSERKDDDKNRTSSSSESQRDESQPGPSGPGESQPGRSALQEPPPRRESLRERQPSRESPSGSLPSPKGLRERQLSRESFSELQPSPKSFRERQPSRESLGERQPSLESPSGSLPSPKGLRERQPSHESLGERIPSREGFRERQPSHESLGERRPSREGFRERQPIHESLGERMPSREGFRERQPSRESPHEPQPENRWLPELECVDYSSSGSGSETHPGMKKGTPDPYVGGFEFPKEHLNLRARDTAGSSGEAEPSERKGDDKNRT